VFFEVSSGCRIYVNYNIGSPMEILVGSQHAFQLQHWGTRFLLRRMHFIACAIGLSPDATLTVDLVGISADRAGFLGAVAAGLGEDAITAEGFELC
jgi:hypothetical protein